jgi:UDP-N-acetylmuramyl tripeptide synthase
VARAEDRALQLLTRAWRTGGPGEAPQMLAATELVLRSSRLADRRPVAPLPEAELSRARAVGAAARERGGGGTTLPGKELLMRRPDALRRLGQRLSEGTVLVAGTNGKTTTASMIATILSHAGVSVTHNRAGANMHWGVATALLEQDGDLGVLEVDEAWLPLVAAELEPRTIVVGNLFRDRPDGYGELDAIVSAWSAMARWATDTTFVLDADDPAVVAVGAAAQRSDTILYGIEDRAAGRPPGEHAADAALCRTCGARLRFERSFLSHLGHYGCEACGARRPAPDVSAQRIAIDGLDGSRVQVLAGERTLDVRVPLPGIYNVYNALAAIAAATALGVDDDTILEGLASVRAPFGRSERIQVDGHEVLLFLMKNPAGANELMRMLGRGPAEPAPHWWLALNDDVADGRDVSWIWDVDFEQIADRVGRVTCSGSRAPELALRLKYAGWPSGAIAVDEAVGPSLQRALEHAPGRLFALPTYSALIELRVFLTERGAAPPYWA